jgi:hypothetical protein
MTWSTVLAMELYEWLYRIYVDHKSVDMPSLTKGVFLFGVYLNLIVDRL